jgi:hypothetical protein
MSLAGIATTLEGAPEYRWFIATGSLGNHYRESVKKQIPISLFICSPDP